ncbi:PqqD family protein [Microbacteriaceae bacterium K1510]|nr:PqqD family protein [Microbacteriaceae bacterium K1510]
MKRNSPPAGDGEDPATRYRFYGDQFVLDTLSGNFYRVTPTAGFILRRLVAGRKPGELVNVVADHFKIDRARALRDVEMFMSELRSLGIIEGVDT